MTWILAVLLLGVCVGAALDSETARTAEQNVQDHGGLLEDEYNAIDFAQIPQPRFDDDEHFLPDDMLSIELRREQKCFFQDVLVPGPKNIHGAWFVSTSGNTKLDVTVKLIDREKKESGDDSASELVLHHDVSEDSGGFNVDGNQAGTYAFCFYSLDPTQETVLTFSIDVKRAGASQSSNDGKQAYPLELSASRLLHTMQSLHQELEVVLLRFERHMQTQDSLEGRVDLFTFVETGAILIVTLCQIYYVRRLVNRSRQWV